MSAAKKSATPAPAVTRTLAGMVAGLRYDDLDARTRHRAKYHFLDGLGACLGGATQEVTGIAERALLKAGVGGGMPVPARASRLDMLSAAYVLGTAGHGLELDDGYTPGSVHPGVVMVPALLAAGHALDASGERIVTAMVAGYEVMCRLAAAMHPKSRWRGFHNTSIMGPFGAAAGWAVLNGFDADRIEHAFGAAASTASGLFTFMHGGDVKRLHPGFAARSGLLAGLLAGEGLQGPPGAIESSDGFLQAYGGGDVEPGRYAGIDILRVGRGSPFAIAECYIKPYPACRHIHGAVDAVLDMRAKDGLAAEAVERIEVGTYEVAAAHDLPSWDSFTSAQMSIPFVVATALIKGGVELGHFTAEARTASPALALARKVATSVDAECNRGYPRARPTRVRVLTRDGRRLERLVTHPYGEPENPLSDAALTAKFLAVAGPVLGRPRAEEVADEVWRLDEIAGLRALVNSLHRPHTA